MSKADAIAQFKRLFFEKTGNPWDAWEQKNFQKQPGKFFPLDIVHLISYPDFLLLCKSPLLIRWMFNYCGCSKILTMQDYGVNKPITTKSNKAADSKLAPPVLELMKMLFNVDTYRYQTNGLPYLILCRILNFDFHRAAMMEFEINMSEMPLGKLSKSNIQKGMIQFCIFQK